MHSTASASFETDRSDRMSTGETSGPIHPVPTGASGYRYQFYDKHHGHGARDVARWLPEMSEDEEFAVFDTADANAITDERGWLYGVRPRDNDGEVPDLGTWGPQVAEFPHARPNETWHGYPLWPLVEAGPENRRGEKSRPSKDVFSRMVEMGMLTGRERKRLQKGDHL